MKRSRPPALHQASALRSACARGPVFGGLWLLLLPSAKPADLIVGAVVCAAATVLSLRLLAPRHSGIRLLALLGLLPHFIWESVRGGLDVAKRAFSPSMPLKPGFVECPVGLPPGMARNTFASITGLMPGTLPVADCEGGLLYHCLDTEQAVVAQLHTELRLLARAFEAEGGGDHG